MEKLIVLDLTDQSIDVYNVSSELNIDEDFITFLGHDIDNCSWMVNSNGELKLTEHQGIYIKDEFNNYDNVCK